MTREIGIRVCASEADEQLSLDIYNAVCLRQAASLAEAQWWKAGALDGTDMLAEVDGGAVGSATVAIFGYRPDVGFALLTVLPEKRRLGAGTALYKAVSVWVAARRLAAIHTRVEDDDEASLEFARRRGFTEIVHNAGVVLDLTAIEEPQVAPPAGIDIVTWAERPELASGIYEVAVEAYADIPGGEDEEMEPFEDWLLHDMQGPSDKPEATFLAVAGDEVVGYAKFHLSPARPTVAAHDMTAVKRAWRGKGLARALKCAQIAWAKRSGLQELTTTNEVRNEPIRRLNAELGYHPAPGSIMLEGPLAGTATGTV